MAKHCKYTLDMKVGNKKYIIYIPGLESNITGCNNCGGYFEIYTEKLSLRRVCTSCE